jgi:hypothetical protein
MTANVRVSANADHLLIAMPLQMLIFKSVVEVGNKSWKVNVDPEPLLVFAHYCCYLVQPLFCKYFVVRYQPNYCSVKP